MPAGPGPDGREDRGDCRAVIEPATPVQCLLRGVDVNSQWNAAFARGQTQPGRHSSSQPAGQSPAIGDNDLSVESTALTVQLLEQWIQLREARSKPPFHGLTSCLHNCKISTLANLVGVPVRTRRYFCWSLGLPFVLALPALPIDRIRGVAFVFLATLPVYLPLAVWTCSRIKRATRLEDILGFTLSLPPLFATALAVVVGATSWSIAGPIIGFFAGFIGLFVGLGFFMLVWALYFLLLRTSYVTAEFTWTPENA